MIARMRPAGGIDWTSRRTFGRGHRNAENRLGNFTSLFDSADPESGDTSELAEEEVWGTLGSFPANSPSSSRSSSRESSPSPRGEGGSRKGSSSQLVSAYGESRESSSYGEAPRSAPVKVPDWTKLHGASDEEESEEEGEERLPPHEIVAREHAREPTSVIEGAGRKLKGRDLSNVRNAVWKHTGFFG